VRTIRRAAYGCQIFLRAGSAIDSFVR
jgi:hypothetical protein